MFTDKWIWLPVRKVLTTNKLQWDDMTEVDVPHGIKLKRGNHATGFNIYDNKVYDNGSGDTPPCLCQSRFHVDQVIASVLWFLLCVLSYDLL